MAIIVQLIEISSPDHYALWNALSVETLAGDIRGEYKEKIHVIINRVRSAEDLPSLIERLKEYKPHIVGISVEVGSLELMAKFYDSYSQLTSCFNPKPLLVLGNKLPTNFPDYFLKRYPDSIIVIGEGEEALRGLIEHLLNNKEINSIPNLAYMNKDRQIHYNFQKNPDLSLLNHPPGMDTVTEVVKNGGNAILQSSRGCSWSNCIYCTNRSFRKGRKWEPLPTKRILQNISDLINTGISELEFVDDEFFGGIDSFHINRIYKLIEGIRIIQHKTPKRITFRIFLIPHTIYKKHRQKENQIIKELLQQLKEVGLTKIFIGIESGCSSQIARYQRGYSIEELEAIIFLLKNELKIELDAGFIMFDPELTLDEMLENIRFFRKWNLIKNNQWPFRPLNINSGSGIYEAFQKKGLLENFNINLMCYDYRFKDKTVQQIYDTIDFLSSESRSIFYALKGISKRQFDIAKKDKETLLAQDYVERNGLIYLDLMELLANNFLKKTGMDIAGIIMNTRKDIDELVAAIRKDIQLGNISDNYDYIIRQIFNYQNRKL